MAVTFRCIVCEEAFLINSKPTHCPFCSCHEGWLVEAQNYTEPEDIELTEISKNNLEFTYDLEMRKSRFYDCIRKETKDSLIQDMFMAISQVELKHAELVGKIIGKDFHFEVSGLEEICSGEKVSTLNMTQVLEAIAINQYKKFLEEASEPRVKIIFQGLLEAEHDHLSFIQENF